MEQEEFISKKELLLLTGISYGQLYRWKRQNLIPDAWFMKQSSFTGQETFFPKRKVLDRIETILKMKDSHSLEELAQFFTPETIDRTYSLLDAMEALGIPSADAELCLQLWGKQRLRFIELLLVFLLGRMSRDAALSQEDRRSWLLTAYRWAEGARTDKTVVMYQHNGKLAYLLTDASGTVELDADSERIANYDLSELAKQLHHKLRQNAEG